MNKAFCRKRIIFSFILAGCLILFNLSCGLDTFYVVDAPSNAIHQPDCSSIEFSDNYFDFYTNDKEYDSIKFHGTDVYYKIYKSSERLKSEANSLISASNRDDSNTNNSAADSLIQNYKFQPLRAAGHDETVLIPTTGSNQRVTIRLSDYQGIYLAQITVDGENIYDSDSRVIPVRNLPNRPSFNFTSVNLPKSEDADVNTSGTSTADKEWYVSMFAVAVGQDATYSPVYSNILYLGSVKIAVD